MLSIFSKVINFGAAKISAGEVGIPATDAGKVIANGLNVFYFISGAIAVIVIILSGLTFVISRGDPGSIKKAKDTLLYAVAGLIVILCAFAITQFIIGSLK